MQGIHSIDMILQINSCSCSLATLQGNRWTLCAKEVCFKNELLRWGVGRGCLRESVGC
jgi:hypothetical protein